MLNKSNEYLNNILAGVIPQLEIDGLKNDIIKFKKNITPRK